MGHRSNPVSSRLNITTQWDKVIPSKFNDVYLLFLKYYIVQYSITFFKHFYNKRITRKFVQNKIPSIRKFVKQHRNYIRPYQTWKRRRSRIYLKRLLATLEGIFINQYNLLINIEQNSYKFNNKLNVNFNYWKNIEEFFPFLKIKEFPFVRCEQILSKKLYKDRTRDYAENTYQSRFLILFSMKKNKNPYIQVHQQQKFLFYYFHDQFLFVQKSMVDFNFCIFSQQMGYISLKFYFVVKHIESEYYNYVRFSQRRLRLRLKKLFFFRDEERLFFKRNKSIFRPKFTEYLQEQLYALEKGELKDVHPKWIATLLTLEKYKNFYKIFLYYDFKFSRQSFFNLSPNFSNKILYLLLFYLKLSQNFSNFYLKYIIIILIKFKHSLYIQLRKQLDYKFININFFLTSFSYSNSFLISKYLKFRLGNYESLGRVVFSFFKFLLKNFSKYRRIKREKKRWTHDNKYKNKKFFLIDRVADFNGYIQIFGLKVLASGRFTRRRRVKHRFFDRGGIPLNSLHANIDYSLAEIPFKYGIAGIKVWLYRSKQYKNF